MIRATVIKVEDGRATILTEPVLDPKNPGKTIMSTICCEAKEPYSFGQTLEFYVDKKKNVDLRVANPKVDSIDNRIILDYLKNLGDEPNKDN